MQQSFHLTNSKPQSPKAKVQVPPSLQFKAQPTKKNLVKRPSGSLYHNKSAIWERGPLFCLSNSSFVIESPCTIHKDLRPSSPQNNTIKPKTPTTRFKSSFETACFAELQKFANEPGLPDYQNPRPLQRVATYSPSSFEANKNSNGNSSGPKLKKKLTFDVGLRTPAFLLDDSEPSAVFKHAIDSPQEPSFRRCKQLHTLNKHSQIEKLYTQSNDLILTNRPNCNSPDKTIFAKSSSVKLFKKKASYPTLPEANSPLSCTINPFSSNRYSQKSNFAVAPTKCSDFKRGKLLGKGHFGEVYFVQHIDTGFICAMKVIPKAKIRQEKIEQQMSRELKLHSFVRHTNLIQQYGFFADEQSLYILMQLCPEGQLYNLIKRKKRLSEHSAAVIVKQVCDGLHYMHQQHIIHRDIKPENIILTYGAVKICDFGWAVNCGEGMRDTRCGTPLYLSPEMIQGQKYDQSVDVWAVGILTYELICGRLPFKIQWEGQLNRIVDDEVTFPNWIEVSDTAKSFILEVLEKNPTKRLQIEDLLHHPFLKNVRQTEQYYAEIQ